MTKFEGKPPCGSCPYKKDTPSGIWSREDYEKLPAYDNDTAQQPIAMFLCHLRNGSLCSGWCGTHDMNQNLAIRLGAAFGRINEETLDVVLDYVSPVPLWSSGKEAHDHGVRDIFNKSEEAEAHVQKLLRHPKLRGGIDAEDTDTPGDA